MAADPLQPSGASNYIAKTGDCIGNDIEAFTLPLADCESRCDESAFCLGVSFRASDNRCVPKRATCSTTTVGDHQFFAKAYTAMNGDCIGNDIEVVTMQLAACESRCDNNASCLGVSFRASDNRCVPKRATCSTTTVGDHQFFTKASAKAPLDCPGNDIEVIVLPLADCKNRCDNNMSCLGVSFRANDDRCVLKRATCSNPVPADHQFYQQR